VLFALDRSPGPPPIEDAPDLEVAAKPVETLSDA
jgi:hypothetical protein